MSRAEILSLTNLVDASTGGGYTLPAELTDAYATYCRVRAIASGLSGFQAVDRSIGDGR